MATYVIGDIHGCYQTLERLLRRLRFTPGQDRLWLVGDLVNRGPLSLEVLRWARSLERSIIAVLGNHDLHLLARALDLVPAKDSDTLEPVLTAPDRNELTEWLRRRPFVHCEGDYLMVHAGVLPQWDRDQVLACSHEAEAAFQRDLAASLLKNVSQRRYTRWDSNLESIERYSAAIQVFTRLRTCTFEGERCLHFSGPPDEAPPGCLPWFSFAGRKTRRLTLLFGHWAALGWHRSPGVFALDSGCVWGGGLTALRLEDKAVFQEPCADRFN
ncbi:MAG: symmetrical bis(5'-nucleosyl)-tetraphosphatase [Acidobacteriota bacterium]